MKKISSHIDNLLMKIFDKQGKLFVLCLKNWSKVVDEKLNDTTYPVKISYSNKQTQELATLWVAAQNSVAAFQVNMNANTIVDRINILIGFQAIDSIRTKIISPHG